jgi:diacylglycerol kinase (ATP)
VGNVMPKLSPDWCFVDCTYYRYLVVIGIIWSSNVIRVALIAGCTAERFFRIDRAQESLHYLIDITHDQLFILDDPQGPPSTEEDLTVVLKAKESSEDLGAQDMTRSVK